MNLLGTPPQDASCPNQSQVIDASSWQCSNLCPDDSRPVGGQCVGYTGLPYRYGIKPLYLWGGLAIAALALGWWVVLPALGIGSAAHMAGKKEEGKEQERGRAPEMERGRSMEASRHARHHARY
jgi:hypothetical protein